MKHRIPLFLSLALSLAGLALFYLHLNLPALSVLTLAFIASIPAFKRKAGRDSAFAHALPALIMAYMYFDKNTFPFLPLALLIASLQNAFVEVFFPTQMYSNSYFKTIAGVCAVACYLTGNLLYPSGWEAWTFPGVVLVLANLLTLLITMDMLALKEKADKGYIQVGSECPDFCLPDEAGHLISGKDFRGNFLLLIFVRGDWCPGCHIMLRTYQRLRDKFLSRDVNLISIGPDPLGVNKEMIEKLGLSYHILSDEKQTVARQFFVELQNPGSAAPGHDFIPLPASFLIDKQGIIRFTSRPDKAGEILYPDRVFEVLDSLK